MDTAESTALVNKIRKHLEELQRQLFIAQAGVAVTTQALKNQDAEQDFDIACVLEQLVGSCISKQLERTDALIAVLELRRPDIPSIDQNERKPVPLQ